RDIRRLLTDHIWLSVTAAAARSEVLADRTALREALTDLALCFGNVMPPGNAVSIETSNIPAMFPHRQFGALATEYLVIELRNSADRAAEGEEGAEPEAHLFEGAAAKPASGPIMLALVILHDVVTYAGGFIEIASNDRTAKTVRVFLPLR